MVLYNDTNVTKRPAADKITAVCGCRAIGAPQENSAGIDGISDLWLIKSAITGIAAAVAFAAAWDHKRSLKASFYIAIQDDCVRKNPFDFKLSEVLENDTKEKVALTEEHAIKSITVLLTFVL